MLLLSASCVPHVAHGPRIEPGSRYFISSAVVHASELQNERASLIPSLYVGAARGWVRADSGQAVSVGLQLPIYLMPVVFGNSGLGTLAATSYLDVYAQPRRAPPGVMDYGVGALLSTGVLMPYVQLGRAADEGVYTTHGAAVTWGALNRASYLLSAVAYRSGRADRSRAVDLFANGAVDLGGPDPEWFVGFGVAVEFRKKH